MNKQTEIVIEADTEAQRILAVESDNLARELAKSIPGVSLTLGGSSDGTKDAATIITATAALIVASTPILTQLISGWFAKRNIDISLEADAKNGKIRYRASKAKSKKQHPDN